MEEGAGMGMFVFDKHSYPPPPNAARKTHVPKRATPARNRNLEKNTHPIPYDRMLQKMKALAAANNLCIKTPAATAPSRWRCRQTPQAIRRGIPPNWKASICPPSKPPAMQENAAKFHRFHPCQNSPDIAVKTTKPRIPFSPKAKSPIRCLSPFLGC